MLTDGSELDAVLDLATRLAEQAAAVQVREVALDRTTVETKSSGTDLVTEVDRACERLLVEGIVAARPHDAILGEEGTDRPGSSGLRWVLDPLDGTTNFVYGHPGFGVSVAVEVRGVVEVAVVVDSLAGDVFRARRGLGAERDGSPIRTSGCTELAEALVATGFSYDAARRQRQAAVLVELLPKVRDVRRMGAAAVDLCSVACGRVDAYYERGLAPWDHAAGALIAVEAGAEVTGFDGGTASGEGVVAAGGAIAAPLRAALLAAGAPHA